MGAGRRQGAGAGRAGVEARHRPARADRPHARPLRALRRHALRAGGAGAVRQGRHAACRDRGAGRRQGPAARLRADGLRANPRRVCRPRHDRRGAGRQPVRPAPDQGRRRARPFPGAHRGLRPRRNLQVRRPGGQERHRLRSLQADRRLLGHAGGDDRGHHQDAAAARDRADAADPGARAAAGGRGDDGRHRLLLRRVGRRPPARRRRRADSRRRDRRRRRRRDGAAARRLCAVGRPPQAHARGADEAVRRSGERRRSGLAGVLARGARRHAVRGQPRRRASARSGASRPRRTAAPSWPRWLRSAPRRRCSTIGPAA